MDHLSKIDRKLVARMARQRGLRAAHAAKYPGLQEIPSDEAAAKRMDRLCDKGIFASSKLPSGPKLYRFSENGVRLANAPKAWARKPTAAMAAEMISASFAGARLKDHLFLTTSELRLLAQELGVEPPQTVIPGRFVLRTIETSNQQTAPQTEIHVHYWFCELRTPDQILNRIGTIFSKLSDVKLFAELIELRLFGFSIAVPSHAAKAALETKVFPTIIDIQVVPELQDIIRV